MVGYGGDTDSANFLPTDISNGAATTTLYVGGKAMEVITRPGGSIETKTYIGDFAVVTRATQAAVTNTAVHYLHKDHLGSVDTITDSLGQVVQRMSFDASKRSLASPRRANAASPPIGWP
jgi:hypothetical protein